MTTRVDYEPAAEELSPAEQTFLRVVAPLGLDFLTPLQSYVERYGASRYHDWADTVALPASRALSDEPLSFHLYLKAAMLALTPEYLFADFFPPNDARRNHALLEAQLVARLGVPRATDSSNTLSREWRFGVFRVVLTTFPPELQDARLTNSLHQKEPRLAFNAGVSLHADYCRPYPDARLRRVLELSGHASRALAPAAGNAELRLVGSRRDTLRNPAALVRAIPAESLLVWRDDAVGRVGVSSHEQSLVAAGAELSSLVLFSISERRRQRAELTASYTDGRPALALLSASGPRPLDAAARVVSELWQLPLEERNLDAG